MHFGSSSFLLAVGALASTTAAFLIPPELPGINEHDDFKDTRFRGGPPAHIKDFFHNVLAKKTTQVELACPDCPFPVEDPESDAESAPLWLKNVDSVIHLDFDTHDHTLNVNGQPLLPLDKAGRGPFRAYMVRKDTGAKAFNVPINFALEVMAPIPNPHRDGVSMIPVEFSILALAGLPVKVNTVALKLVQPPNHDFVLVKTELVPFNETPGAQECQESKYWIPCRWQALITARIQAFMEMARSKSNSINDWVKTKAGGCHGIGPHGKGPRPHGPSHERPQGHPHAHPHGHPHDMPPHHRNGPHGRHGHFRHHRVGHIVHQTFRFLIIPALLGIVGGLTASALGMMVGRAIVYSYITMYRGGERGPLQSEQVVIVVDDAEKEVLLNEQEDLPAYEDSPAYSAINEKDIESESAVSTRTG